MSLYYSKNITAQYDSSNESGGFGALKSDSTHHFFRNACTKSGSLRFSQFSGCWLISSVYIIMNFDFPFVRLFGVRQFCYYPYLPGDPASSNISRVSDTLITPHYWSRKCWNEGQRSTIKYTVRNFDFYLFLYWRRTVFFMWFFFILYCYYLYFL